MSFACATAQLPIAPRPVHSELFSSWMLRVASGNCISLRELLEAVEPIYPEALAIRSLDLSIPPLLLRTLSRFCRVPVRTLQALDLRQRYLILRRLCYSGSPEAIHFLPGERSVALAMHSAPYASRVRTWSMCAGNGALPP